MVSTARAKPLWSLDMNRHHTAEDCMLHYCTSLESNSNRIQLFCLDGSKLPDRCQESHFHDLGSLPGWPVVLLGGPRLYGQPPWLILQQFEINLKKKSHLQGEKKVRFPPSWVQMPLHSIYCWSLLCLPLELAKDWSSTCPQGLDQFSFESWLCFAQSEPCRCSPCWMLPGPAGQFLHTPGGITELSTFAESSC